MTIPLRPRGSTGDAAAARYAVDMAIPQRIAPLAARAASLLPTATGDRARFVASRRDLENSRPLREPRQLVERLLRRADAAHAQGESAAAVDWADKALQILFHPQRHYGDAISPLSRRGLEDLQPLRRSTVGRLLMTSPDPQREVRPGGSRVLVLAGRSWTFIDRVIKDLEGEGTFEFRTRDLSELPVGERPSRRGVLEARYEASTTGARITAPPSLVEDLAWADVIWMEWATYTATWLTLLDGIDARIVVRLHSYESFTPYPQMMDMAQVDELVFVAPQVRELVCASAPRAEQAGRISVVPNINDFSEMVSDKLPGAGRTLIQVGWANPVKDVEFTLDVLEDLRREDPSWTLLLAGSPIGEDDADPRSRRIRERLAAAGEAVEVLGFREDMPQVLRRAGYIVSASRHEAAHEAIAEGAAAGCVPVVRNWPEFAEWGGAASMFPMDWIVTDARGAADRIRSTADEGFDPAREDARRWLFGERDPEGTRRAYVRTLIGDHGTEKG